MSDFQQYRTHLAKVIQFFVSPEKCENQSYEFLTRDRRYILGAQKDHLIEKVLLNTHNICFGCELKKTIFLVHTLN